MTSFIWLATTGQVRFSAVRRFAVTHSESAPAVLGDAGLLPFADEAFDLVVAYMCLHDIDEMPRAVSEIARVLEPSRRLFSERSSRSGCWSTRSGKVAADEESIQHDPDRRWQRIPMFPHIRAVKPG